MVLTVRCFTPGDYEQQQLARIQALVASLVVEAALLAPAAVTGVGANSCCNCDVWSSPGLRDS
jgi:hypothetical protein